MAKSTPAWKRLQLAKAAVTLPPDIREFFASLANSARGLIDAIDSPAADPLTPYGEQRSLSLMLNHLSLITHFGPDGLQATGGTVGDAGDDPQGIVIGELLPAAVAIYTACRELQAHWRFDGEPPASGDYADKEYCWTDPVPATSRDKLEYGARTIEAILADETKSLNVAAGNGAADPDVSLAHSLDFASVNWRGTVYTFTTNQAACVKVLHSEWKNGTPVVGQAELLEAAGVSQEDLRKVFQGHDAWNTLIISPSKGRYRLAEPSPKEKTAGGKSPA